MALTSLPAETERDRQTDTETENANERGCIFGTRDVFSRVLYEEIHH